MTESQDQLDPEIKAQLDLLKEVPDRDTEAAARGRAHFIAQARQFSQSQNRGRDPISAQGVSLSLVERLARQVSRNHRNENPLNRKTTSLALIGTLAFLIVVIFGGSTLTAFAAQDALPGDALYGLKNATESARVSLTQNAAQDAALHMEFAQRRVDEISALISQERYQALSQATDGFERHIFQGLIALTRVAAQDPGRAQAVTDQMMGILADYTTAILSLVDRVPPEFQLSLQQAALASQAQLMASEIEFTGIVMEIGSEAWKINTLSVQVLPTTELDGDIQVGELVKVHAVIEPDGTLAARLIEPAHDDEPEIEEVELTGIVETMRDESWVISGVTVAITFETEVEDLIQVGDSVEVKARLGEDGELTALQIKLDDDVDDAEIDDGEDDMDDGDDNSNGDGDDNDDGGDDNDDDGNDNDDDGNDNDGDENDDSNDNGDDKDSGDEREDEDDNE